MENLIYQLVLINLVSMFYIFYLLLKKENKKEIFKEIQLTQSELVIKNINEARDSDISFVSLLIDKLSMKEFTDLIYTLDKFKIKYEITTDTFNRDLINLSLSNLNKKVVLLKNPDNSKRLKEYYSLNKELYGPEESPMVKNNQKNNIIEVDFSSRKKRNLTK